jgi:hypothetical protein
MLSYPHLKVGATIKKVILYQLYYETTLMKISAKACLLLLMVPQLESRGN